MHGCQEQRGAPSRGPLPVDTTGEPIRDRGAVGYLYGNGKRHSAAELSMEEERYRDFWCDLRELHDAYNEDFRQRITIHSAGEQRRW